MRGYLTEEAAKDIEKGFDRTRRAWQILDLVVAEWESDPASVQCFDLRLVDEARNIVRKQKKSLDPYNPLGENQ